MSFGELRLSDLAQQLCLQYVFPFFVLLGLLECLVIGPSDELFALTTLNIPNNVLARRHTAFFGFANRNVDDLVE